MAIRRGDHPIEKGAKRRLALAEGRRVSASFPACASCGLPVAAGGHCSNCNRHALVVRSRPDLPELPGAFTALAYLTMATGAVTLSVLVGISSVADLAQPFLLPLILLLACLIAGAGLAQRGQSFGRSLWMASCVASFVLGACTPVWAGWLLLLTVPSLMMLVQPQIQQLYRESQEGSACRSAQWLGVLRQITLTLLALPGLLVLPLDPGLIGMGGLLGLGWATLNACWYRGAFAGCETSRENLHRASRFEAALAMGLTFLTMLGLAVSPGAWMTGAVVILMACAWVADRHARAFSGPLPGIGGDGPTLDEPVSYRILPFGLASMWIAFGFLVAPGWIPLQLAFGPGAFLLYLVFRQLLRQHTVRVEPVGWDMVSAATALEIPAWTLLLQLLVVASGHDKLVMLITRLSLLPALAVVFWLATSRSPRLALPDRSQEPRRPSDYVADFMRRKALMD